MRKKDDQKQKNIKEAVIKLTLEEGFHGTSISKIAKVAGVSPATVYVYYENKELMFQEIYLEYSEEIFDKLLSKVRKDMDGKELMEVLARSYYNYIQENEEIFRFVDQFSSCPALANSCGEKRGIKDLNRLLDEQKKNKIIKDIHNYNLNAMIFSPIKAIAINHCIREEDKLKLLKEIIIIIQSALLL